MFAELFYNVRDFVVGPNVDERRIVPRVRCNINLSCLTSQGAQICTLKDLSACGARLSTDKKWKKGDQVQLMPPKGMGKPDAGLKATVMWSRPVLRQHQVGLKFRSRVTGSWVEDILRELGLSPTIPRQRRDLVRFPADLKLTFSVHGGNQEAYLRNLSLGGALITCEQRLSSGIPIQIFLPGVKMVPRLDLVGKTCGCKKGPDDKHEVSVKFGDLSPQQKKTLVRHLNELMSQARAH